MRAYVLTGPEALKTPGIDVKTLSAPAPAPKNGPAVYVNINPQDYDELFKIYHYAVYPRYLDGAPAIFAVPSLPVLFKKLQGIPDPPPVSCPLTGEKLVRHLSRLPQVKKMPANLNFAAKMEPVVEAPLDPDQKVAAAHFTGPALVVAPAGSGKTMTVTARVLLLTMRGIDPSRILCLTFTRKAQEEMQERLVHALGKADGAKVTVRTYHSLAYTLIGELTGKKPRIVTDRRPVLAELIEKSEARPDVDDLDEYISLRLNSLEGPEEADPKGEKEKQFAEIYAAYMERMERDGFTDQDNLLYTLYRLLRDDPAARSRLLDYSPPGAGPRQPKGRWQFVLVDEAQDNNLAQDVLTRFLAAPWDNIYWVGDEDQLLYTFRGSSLERILNLKKTYPNLKELYLKTNYRSLPAIVKAADKLIRHNELRRRKTIVPSRKGSGVLEFHAFDDLLAECEWAAAKIKGLLDAGKNPEDIAVLYRTNAQADAFAEVLSGLDVPHFVHRTGRPLFETAEAEVLLDYLSVLSGNDDLELLLRVLQVPPRAKKPDKLAEALKDAAYPLDVLRAAAESLKEWKVVEFCNDLRTARLIAGSLPDAGQAARYARLRFELDKYFSGSETSDRLNILEAIAAKFSAPEEFVAWVKRARARQRNGDARSAGKVQLMTVHSAKGLEFPAVFLVNCTEGHFPHLKAKTAEEIEEERRIFYVGMTRAMDALYVSGYETEERPLSRFLREAELTQEPCKEVI